MKKRLIITASLFSGITWVQLTIADDNYGPGFEQPGPLTPCPDHRRNYIPDQIIVRFRTSAAETIARQLQQGTAPARLALPPDLHRLNAKYEAEQIQPVFRNFKENRRRRKALQAKSHNTLTPLQKRLVRRQRRTPLRKNPPDLDAIYKITFTRPTNHNPNQILAAYRNCPQVEYAERNYIFSIHNTPNDPLYPCQWSLNNIGQDYPRSGKYNPPPGLRDKDIDMPDAWDKTTTADVIVAVLDTGIDYTHRDLLHNIWTNQSEVDGTTGLDDDDNGYVDDILGYDFANDDPDPADDLGHGTHCAGIIAAEGNNNLDIAGVCWNTQVMALKWMDCHGEGTLENAVNAIYYAVENGADVISNSWGAAEPSQTLRQAIDYARSRGVVVLASAGNNGSADPFYPAFYDSVIAVAATNSRDEKPPFSTYGQWVDIAAPGVDILSLRAAGTSMGTIHDDHTTVLSGTSMACPYVAAACALALSAAPDITIEQFRQVLTETADAIDPQVCASGRLNICAALLRALGPEGTVWLNRDIYGPGNLVEIRLFDTDLKYNSTQQITLLTTGGDTETLILYEETGTAGIFSGSISTAAGPAAPEDTILQIADGRTITAVYHDLDNGTTGPATVTDTAGADCEPPAIVGIDFDIPGPEPVVFFQTTEETTAAIRYAPACNDPDYCTETDAVLTTNHAVTLTNVSPATEYFFVIEADDYAGNHITDDNAGSCFSFTTTEVTDLAVPSDYPTIQQAVDRCWPGATIRVNDGSYSDCENRDIDFKAKAITLKSRNGPLNCIIDCQASTAAKHRAFYFHCDESANSVVEGFTIENGCALNGGAICCETTARPTIKNCIFQYNHAVNNGGALYNCHGLINQCTIRNNSAGNNGGGLFNCDGIISNCLIIANTTADYGGGLENCDGLITNCTIVGNAADYGGGLYNCDGLPANSIVWDNRPTDSLQYTSSIGVYSCLQTSSQGTGCISSPPRFLEPGYWDPNDTPEDLKDDFYVPGNYHLSPDSPCIDAGSFPYCMTLPCTDLDANTRLTGPAIDMGCYETDADPDSDGDWLADADEPNFAQQPDRDADNLLDGIELIAGSDPNCFDPPGPIHVPADTNTIQNALFLSRTGQTIVLNPGTYYQQLHFGGRNVNLTGTYPNDWSTIQDTILNADTDQDPHTANGRAVTLLGFETPACCIHGLTITAGYLAHSGGAAIYGAGSNATIRNCFITANTAKNNGAGLQSCDGLITNCIFSANKGSALAFCNGRISNCTILGNAAAKGPAMRFCPASITNSIIYQNRPQDQPLSSSSDPLFSCLRIPAAGPGCITADPCFATPGYWDENATPDNPADDFWVDGDYHLKSLAGRWEPITGQWLCDQVTSRCIDAGSPADELRNEHRTGSNLRVNIGAFGGTAQASIPPPGWTLLADLTNNGKVELADLTWWLNCWLSTENNTPADLNRDSATDLADFARLAADWLAQTTWHQSP